METIASVLSRHSSAASVLPFELRTHLPLVFDFSAANSELAQLDLDDTPAFAVWVNQHLADADPPVAVGRYGEDRVIYRHSPLFDGTVERRSVHLGIDLFAAPGTGVFAPFDGVVHSFADNDNIGDYGPTVVLEHEIDGRRFWTLYGHLSRPTLHTISLGQRIGRGTPIATLGNLQENGAWPPHLHFQIISDMSDFHGNYPGVAARSQRNEWFRRCPDPNLILKIPGLEPCP